VRNSITTRTDLPIPSRFFFFFHVDLIGYILQPSSIFLIRLPIFVRDGILIKTRFYRDFTRGATRDLD
jgi:hypothetical protein